MHRFCLAASLAILCPHLLSAQSPDGSLGRKIGGFTLQDYRGQEHSLPDEADAKVVVLAFLGTECPLAKLYAPRLDELFRKNAEAGVAFFGVNANVHDSMTEVAAYARRHGISFPILKDVGNRLADRLGAERTPEVFVLDAGRVVRYRGRIDDQYGIGYAREKPTSTPLADALEALLAGRDVAIAQTEAEGCLIGRVREPKPDSAVTYSNQIARLLQKRCVECHREGEIAPFALTDYDEVAGWAEMINEVVKENRMPPWHANPEHGTFANERRLTDDEKQLIRQWLLAGAPQGDPAELPAPIEYTEGWQLPRRPDAVISMRESPYDVPAEGVVRYQYFTVDPGFTEDKWVKMAEAIPGNPAVVHHILVFVRPPEERKNDPAAGGGEYLVGFVPGLRARPYPQGMAKLIPAGSKLVFQMHYTPIGSPQQDVSKLGLIFADRDEVDHVVVTSQASTGRKLLIPAGDANYRSEATTRGYPRDLLLLSLMPHMHLRGRSFSYEALYPDDKSQLLLDVPRYDFNWQTAYILAEPLRLPAGTRIRCVAHHDNSVHNLANPDPTATVHWGDQTWDEMMIGYMDVAVPLEAEDKASASGNTPNAREDGNRAAQIVQKYDKNNDGRIARDEIPDRLRRLFSRVDADRDGMLTVEEVAGSLDQLR